MQILNDAGLSTSLFDQGEAEPSVALAVRVAEQAVRPQAIIGLGGGSNMDLAKIAAMLVTHGGEPAKYFSFSNNVPGLVLPIVGVPTTAGNRNWQVSDAFVLTDTVNHIKVSTLSNYLWLCWRSSIPS